MAACMLLFTAAAVYSFASGQPPDIVAVFSVFVLIGAVGIVDLIRTKIVVTNDLVRYTHLGRTKEINPKAIARVTRSYTPMGIPLFTVVVTFDQKRVLLPAATYLADGNRLVQKLYDLAAENMYKQAQIN
jgi:hypothetical protein